MEHLAPIVLFVYKRPEHTLQTLESLHQNPLSGQSSLYIFADAAKSDQDQASVNQVREIIRQKQWCKEVHIIERAHNFGLAKNIIEGVTQIVQQFGKVIVLEDDLVVSSSFLHYMNQALQAYQHQAQVMQVSGHVPPIKFNNYSPDTFFYNKIATWGWGTWASAWQQLNTDTSYLLEQIKTTGQTIAFNADGAYDFIAHLEANIQGTLNTWAIKWQASVFLKQGLCLYPGTSLVRNIGFDNSGEHCGHSTLYLTQKIAEKINFEPITVEELPQVRKVMTKHYEQLAVPPSWLQRLKTKALVFIRGQSGKSH